MVSAIKNILEFFFFCRHILFHLLFSTKYLPSLSYPVLRRLWAFGGPGAGPLTGHEEGGGEGRAGAGMWTGHEQVYGRLRSRGMNGSLAGICAG
jgi:hypothetical protein